MTMMRVSTLRTALFAGAALAFVLPPAQAQDVTLNIVHGSPEGHIIAAGGVEPWMSCVTEAAGDRVAFNYYPAGQLSGLRELQAALESGVADAVPIPIGYVSDRLPLNGVAMLPGLGGSADEIITAYSAAVREGILAEEFAAIDAVPIWVMGFPPYQILSTGDPISDLAGFEGKVIRSAGGTMTLAIEMLGAAPAEIPISDTYVALERGTVDGTISALASIKPYNIQELMTGVSTNGAFGTFTNVFAINANVWESVPADLQEVMMDCGFQVEESIAETMDTEATQLAEEFAGMGIEVFEFSDEQLSEINGPLSEVQQDWVDRLEERGLPAQQVLDEYLARIGG